MLYKISLWAEMGSCLRRKRSTTEAQNSFEYETPLSPMPRIVITGLSTTVIRSDPCLLRHRKLWNTHRAVGYGILEDMESKSRSRSRP